MSRTRTLLASAGLVALAAGIVTAPSPAGAADGGAPISTTLSGAAEVPGPGDPDGTGSATLRVNAGQDQVCYRITVAGIAPATAAHVHEAGAGASGPVVRGLAAPADGSSEGCAPVSRQLARDILRDPAAYYVNVHNAEFPAGALRGQLSR